MKKWTWKIFRLEYFPKRLALGIGFDENDVTTPLQVLTIELFCITLQIGIKKMRYIHKMSHLIFGHFIFDFYQLPEYPEIGLCVDWSEPPALFHMQIGYWCVGFDYYKDKNAI